MANRNHSDHTLRLSNKELEKQWMLLLERVSIRNKNKVDLKQRKVDFKKHVMEVEESLKEDWENIKKHYIKYRDELRDVARYSAQYELIKKLENSITDDFEKEILDE